MEIAMLAVALGLSADAKDQELTGRAASLLGLEQRYREITGKAKIEEQMALIEGWREGHAANATAQKELGAIRAQAETDNYKALIKQGEDSAQITPANRAKVLERFTTSAALSAYLETAPAALPGLANAGVKPAIKSGQGSEGAGGGADEKPAVLLYKGKAWADMKPVEQAALFREDRALYDQMRGAAMAQKGGSQ